MRQLRCYAENKNVFNKRLKLSVENFTDPKPEPTQIDGGWKWSRDSLCRCDTELSASKNALARANGGHWHRSRERERERDAATR